MAGFVQPVSTFTAPPDWTAQAQNIQRQQALADYLTKQGLDDSNGQTQSINGVAIRNSPLAGLNSGLRAALGVYMNKQLADKQQELYQQQQDVYKQAGNQLMKDVTPRDAMPGQPGMIDEVGGVNSPATAPTPAYTPTMNDLGSAYARYLGTTGRNDLAAPFLLQNAQRQITMGQMLQPDNPNTVALDQGAQGGSIGPTNANAAAATDLAQQGPTVGGVPMALARRLIAGSDPQNPGKLLAETQAGLFKQQQAPINVRQGGTVFMPGKGPIFSAPVNGIQTQYGPDGPIASPLPGYIPAATGITSAQEQAKAPFQRPVEMPQQGGGSAPMPFDKFIGLGAPSVGGPLSPPSPQPTPQPGPAFGPGMTPASATEPVSGPPVSVGSLSPADQIAARQALSATASGQPAAVQPDPWATMPKLQQPSGAGPQTTYSRMLMEKAADQAGKTAAKLGEAATAANQRIATNNQALDLVDKADTGPLAAQIGDVKNWLVSRFGVPEGDFQNTPTATQALQKDLVNAATQKAKTQFGSRITQSEVMLMLTRGAPNVDMTKAAIKFLVNTDNAQAQYGIQQSNDFGDYMQKGGDPFRFEGWYAQAFPQTDALSKVKPNVGGDVSAQAIADEMRKRGLIK